MNSYKNNLYYSLKPFIPRKIQLILRRKIVSVKRFFNKSIWPIDENACKLPEGWKGWPDKKQFALILTHDVESEQGQGNCNNLIKIEKKLGFISSFNFVAEEYKVLPELRQYLVRNGFEVGVHGLTHDGKLYTSKKVFNQQAKKINKYIKEWKVSGFRSPSMHYNFEWIHDLDIEYDASTFDTDPFEPQPEGVKSIFPFWVSGEGQKRGYVELPYTLPQDFTLFILMQEKSPDIWKRKLDWIVDKGGMALLIAHPDYMRFKDRGCGIDEYPSEYYEEFLNYIKSKYKDKYWNVLPKDISRFWMENYVK